MANRRKWIHGLKKGELHRDLGVPQGKKIPLSELQSAAHSKGKVGQRARFAITARSFKRRKLAGK